MDKFLSQIRQFFKEGEEEIAAALIQDAAENILPIVYISYDPELNQHLIDYKKLLKIFWKCACNCRTKP